MTNWKADPKVQALKKAFGEKEQECRIAMGERKHDEAIVLGGAADALFRELLEAVAASGSPPSPAEKPWNLRDGAPPSRPLNEVIKVLDLLATPDKGGSGYVDTPVEFRDVRDALAYLHQLKSRASSGSTGAPSANIESREAIEKGARSLWASFCDFSDAGEDAKVKWDEVPEDQRKRLRNYFAFAVRAARGVKITASGSTGAPLDQPTPETET